MSSRRGAWLEERGWSKASIDRSKIEFFWCFVARATRAMTPPSSAGVMTNVNSKPQAP